MWEREGGKEGAILPVFSPKYRTSEHLAKGERILGTPHTSS